MPLIFECPHCGYRYDLPTKENSQNDPCPRCRKRFDQNPESTVVPQRTTTSPHAMTGRWSRILAWGYRIGSIPIILIGISGVTSAGLGWLKSSRGYESTLIGGAYCLFGGLLMLSSAEFILLFLQVAKDVRAMRNEQEQKFRQESQR